MGKIAGMDKTNPLPPKVVALYQAVKVLMEQGHYVTDIKVSMITEEAGIGKGTAYEYFDSKEELIACAVAYQVEQMFEMLETELEKRNTVREKLSFVLELEERHQHEKQYLMRFFHMMTDHNELSCMVQQKLQSYAASCETQLQDGQTGCAPITRLLGNLLAQGRESGEIRQDHPIEYQIYAVAAKLLTYMIYSCEQGEIGIMQMHELVLDGIMRELQ